MTFLDPRWLLTLVPVVGLAVAYLVLQRRRQRYAVRFASLAMLDRVVPRRPGWRRHLPTALVLLALAGLGLAAARPEMAIRVPYDRATVIVAIDTSGSMAAPDVPPDRLTAAKSAAVAFVDGLPDTVNVGVVSFAGSATAVVAPTTDHDEVERQIAELGLSGGGTAIGESVHSALDQLARVAAEADGGEVPSRVVVLSDGTNTAGRSPDTAAAAARDAGVPVSTIVYGTPEGIVDQGDRTLRVPVDGETLEALAEATGGTAYTAESGEQLRAVYEDIGSAVGWRVEQREGTSYLAVAALLLGLVAAGLSMRWFSRLI
jgi:Ca-activated chloride channel homolog